MFIRAVVVASLAASSWAAIYRQTASHIGSNFLNGFNVMNIQDPTHGRVNYVDAATARNQNLTYGSGNTFILRADSRNVLNPSGPGRSSVRLESTASYETAAMVFDIRHMPQGCGTWPAVWTFGDPWPNVGEIDILEGVNDVSPNKATLHTSSGCTMPSVRHHSGTAVQDNCDVNANSNAGCGVNINEPHSYGPDFNNNGGGYYAMERTDQNILIWFWPRHASNIPSDVINHTGSVNTEYWGNPSASFPSTQCDIANKFGPNRITINLTFCGDWAGISSIYNGAGCPGSCVDYVNNNPGAFSNAYFDFGSIMVYQ